MPRWTDLAEWIGPTVNHVAGDAECRGLVIHIAEGTGLGTDSWELNPASQVSSHFVVDVDGTITQLVDTDDTAWTEQAGNGHWLSVECAGFTPHPLTPQQVEAVAQLFARTHSVYGAPLQVATSPAGRGLGHHSMGTNGHSVPTDTWTGPTWGHTDCPGPAIVAQKPAIVARAQQIAAGGDDMTPQQAADLNNAIAFRVAALAGADTVWQYDTAGKKTSVSMEPFWDAVRAHVPAPAGGTAVAAHTHAGGQTGPAVASPTP